MLKRQLKVVSCALQHVTVIEVSLKSETAEGSTTADEESDAQSGLASLQLEQERIGRFS